LGFGHLRIPVTSTQKRMSTLGEEQIPCKVRRNMKEIHVTPIDTGLLVIDLQKGFVNKGAFCEVPAARDMLPRIQKLIEVCRKQSIPVIYTRMSHRFIGSTVYRDLWPNHFKEDGRPILEPGSEEFELIDELNVKEEDIVLDKDRYSAFFGTPLDLILKDKGVKTIIITGLASNVCCESTAREAFFLNYRVLFVDDCNVTLNDEMHRWAVENIRLVFGYVLSSNELIKKIQASRVQKRRY
jgi:nicotinamidase-related amidase